MLYLPDGVAGLRHVVQHDVDHHADARRAASPHLGWHYLSNATCLLRLIRPKLP